jgi:hypothetical protein
MCRALHAGHTGRQFSKVQAALWAVGEFPEWSRVIEQALTWRQSPPAIESRAAVDFVKFALRHTIAREEMTLDRRGRGWKNAAGTRTIESGRLPSTVASL